MVVVVVVVAVVVMTVVVMTVVVMADIVRPMRMVALAVLVVDEYEANRNRADDKAREREHLELGIVPLGHPRHGLDGGRIQIQPSTEREDHANCAWAHLRRACGVCQSVNSQSGSGDMSVSVRAMTVTRVLQKHAHWRVSA